jgi:hypothetical protein
MPDRIQLRRTKGWRKPHTAIVVSRPSRFGNPYRVGLKYRWADAHPAPYPSPSNTPGPGEEIERCETVQAAVTWYEAWITTMVPSLADDAREYLAGHDLACWCPPGQPCHADVLLRIANPD